MDLFHFLEAPTRGRGKAGFSFVHSREVREEGKCRRHSSPDSQMPAFFK